MQQSTRENSEPSIQGITESRVSSTVIGCSRSCRPRETASTSRVILGVIVSRLPSVRNSVVAPLGIEDTFDPFFRRMSEWWPLATRSVAVHDAVSCHIEPRVGGRVYERNRNGHEEGWGTILVWDPPSRVVLAPQDAREYGDGS